MRAFGVFNVLVAEVRHSQLERLRLLPYGISNPEMVAFGIPVQVLHELVVGVKRKPSRTTKMSFNRNGKFIEEDLREYIEALDLQFQ